MHTRATCFALACASAGVLVAVPARAEPFTHEQIQLAATIDYGLYVGDGADLIPSPYGVGIGGRAGYTLGPRVFVGTEANYFFGASQSFPEYGDVEASLRILQYGAEAGYDLEVHPGFVVRPVLGLGAARVTAVVRVEGLSGDVSETGVVVTAGAQALVAWQPAFLGLEARYTSLHIDTEALADIPGLEVEDSARLDGVLFAVRGGMYF